MRPDLFISLIGDDRHHFMQADHLFLILEKLWKGPSWNNAGNDDLECLLIFPRQPLFKECIIIRETVGNDEIEY